MVATLTWLIVTEYQCYKRPRICSSCLKHFPSFPRSLLPWFVTGSTRRVHLVEQKSLPLRSTCRFLVGFVLLDLKVFCVVICRSLFTLFLLVIAFSVLRFYGLWLHLRYLKLFLRRVPSSSLLYLRVLGLPDKLNRLIYTLSFKLVH